MCCYVAGQFIFMQGTFTHNSPFPPSMNALVNHQSLLPSKPVKEEDLGRGDIAIEYVEQYLLKAVPVLAPVPRDTK